MDQRIEELMKRSLVLLPEQGIGYLNIEAADSDVYESRYWQNYCRLAETPIGKALTASRVSLVNRFIGNGYCLDIGIGAGQFIEGRGGNTEGYDVNPDGVRWLEKRDCFRNPYEGELVANVSMWDVLEHLSEPHKLLERITGFLFVSMPIYPTLADVTRSKHYKPREHRLLLTDMGIRVWLSGYGFDCVWSGQPETEIGRESIGSYVFLKR